MPEHFGLTAPVVDGFLIVHALDIFRVESVIQPAPRRCPAKRLFEQETRSAVGGRWTLSQPRAALVHRVASSR
jgi:hypothetical protein